MKRQIIESKTMRSPVVEYHGPHSAPALELFACSRLKLGNSVHRGAETIPFLNALPLGLVERVVHVRGRQDHFQHFPAPRVLRTPYSLEVSELHESWDIRKKQQASHVTGREPEKLSPVKLVAIRVTCLQQKPQKRSRSGNRIQ